MSVAPAALAGLPLGVKNFLHSLEGGLVGEPGMPPLLT
jgi:hypothetical protein